MRGFMRLCAAGGVVLASLVGTATATPPEAYPLTKVQRGQTGYGLTTFAGTKPERWTFEVISVVHNMLPKQDIILFKSNDPKLALSGVFRGMSGSPMFIDDKMTCAASYAWSFNRITFGGCTPIDYMKKDGDTYRRKAPVAAGPNGTKVVQPTAASVEDWRKVAPKGDLADALSNLGPRHKSWLLSSPMPAPVQHTAQYDGQTMTASVPLSIAGFSAPAFNVIGDLFKDSTMTPVRAGGTGGVPNGEDQPKAFVPGGAIAIPVIKGDMSAAASGTVTFVDGNKVLAFGHPMFGNGEWYAPVSTAYVHTVVTSMQSAFHMTSPITEMGSLVQDRQAAIMADTTLRSPMIPVNISVTTTHGKQTTKGDFHVDLLDNKFLTAPITGAAVMNAINYYLPDHEDVTARIDSSVRISGEKQPITFVDYVYANDGAASVMGSVRGLRVLVPLINNPYAPVRIEGVDIKVDLKYEINYGEIKEIRVPGSELAVGRNEVEVRMTTYDGKDIFDKVTVDVPASLAGSIVQLEVTAGDSAKLDAAPPVDLPSLIGAVRKLLPGNTWAATIYPADEGVAVEGKLVKDLPATAQDKLHPQSHTQRAVAYKPIARTVTTASRVVEGTSSMLVRVHAAK